MQVVGDVDSQNAVGRVLDGKLDAGFTAEDGRVEEGAGDAQRLRRGQRGEVEEDKQEDESIPGEHEREPMETEESWNSAEKAGEQEQQSAGGERGAAEDPEAAGRVRVGRCRNRNEG